MEKTTANKDFYCGLCHKKYSKKQNWEEHFNTKKSKCYHTSVPRVWAHTLENAIKKYQEEIQQRKNAQSSFSFFNKAGSSSCSKSYDTKEGNECPPPKKRKLCDDDNTIQSQQTLHIEDETDPSLLAHSSDIQNIRDTLHIEEKTEPTLSSQNSDIQKTLDKILRLTTETHQAVVIKGLGLNTKDLPSTSSKSKSACTNTCKSKLKCNQFEVSFAHLCRCKSMKELMNNDLIKSSFKLVEKKDFKADDSFSVPGEILNTIANSNTNMPDVSIAVEEEENDDDDNEKEPDSFDDFRYVLYCTACKDSNICTLNNQYKAYGSFKVKDNSYESKQGQGDLQERWFVNLKKSLKRHVIKLQHHQKAAVFEVMKKNNDKSIKNITDLCGNVLYYILKTNTAWALYPVLLAVLFRSGCGVGNFNHSTHACETLCELLDTHLKKETEEWFKEQESVTITADIGTILGLSMLVLLVMSEADKTVKLVGVNLIRSKSGVYLANELFQMLQNHLDLPEDMIISKVSGMAGDGAFCKDNAPFKSEMKKLFGDHFKFRWDLLHLVNRAHIQAINKVPKLEELLDFVQNHSSTTRSGLDYTNMILDNIVGFKRPKLKSATRMVNYEFDQLDRFVENSKFFDHPYDKVISAKYFVLIALTTKIMLQVAQKTNVKREFIDEIFYLAGGKKVMCELVLQLKNDTLLTDTEIEKLSEESKSSPAEMYMYSEIKKYLNDHLDYFKEGEEPRPSRTRSEETFSKELMFEWISDYIQTLWVGIDERLKHFDKDGTTAWSEAPAEGIFSILEYIVEHKGSIKVSNLTKICRIMKEGPPPGSRHAAELTNKALENWPSKYGAKFTTNSYMKGLTSTTVSAALNK